MSSHCLSGCCRISGCQGLNQFLMTLWGTIGGGQAYRAEPGGGERRRLVNCITQSRASSRFGDAAMQLFMQAEIDEAISVWLHRQSVHARCKFQKLRALFLCGDLGEQHRGLDF